MDVHEAVMYAYPLQLQLLKFYLERYPALRNFDYAMSQFMHAIDCEQAEVIVARSDPHGNVLDECIDVFHFSLEALIYLNWDPVDEPLKSSDLSAPFLKKYHAYKSFNWKHWKTPKPLRGDTSLKNYFKHVLYTAFVNYQKNCGDDFERDYGFKHQLNIERQNSGY